MVARLGILGLNLTDRIRQMLPAVRVATGIVVAPTVAAPSIRAMAALPPET